jgi:hypothetical protein
MNARCRAEAASEVRLTLKKLMKTYDSLKATRMKARRLLLKLDSP